MKTRKIKTKLEGPTNSRGRLGGYLAGPQTYLWFGVDGECAGTLGGRKLKRLAQAIVRHMEERAGKDLGCKRLLDESVQVAYDNSSVKPNGKR